MDKAVTILAAFDHLSTIGKDGQMPWHLGADLKHFKQTTMGHPIVMGRKTFESIGQPLPGRTNLVITRNDDYAAPADYICPSPGAALTAAEQLDPNIYIIGGSSIYEALFPVVTHLSITVVHAEIGGDSFFPRFDPDEWRVRQSYRHSADENNDYAFTRWELERSIDSPPSFEPVRSPTPCPAELRDLEPGKPQFSEDDASI